MMGYKILIIDDEENLRRAIKYGLSGRKFQIIEACNGKDGLAKTTEDIDLIITDLKMPVMDGIKFLEEFRKRLLDIPVIVLTAFGSTETAVNAMKLGATDFLIKPFPLKELEEKATEILKSKYAHSAEKGHDEFIGDSSEIKKIKEFCKKIAPAPSPILITGESGTGKEVISRYIHKISGKKGNFVAINCGALPETLLESELFGYKKGSFTGAISDNPGYFSVAKNGTLLLDEIGDISQKMQVSLLRVIQEKEYTPIGSSKPVPTNARIIAATNKDLGELVKNGKFRKDLFYRLSVFRISLPPLRDRKDDIIKIAEFLLYRISKKSKKKSPILSENAKKVLLSYRFPGNIRELSNILERAIWISDDNEISAENLGLNQEASFNESDTSRMEFKEKIEHYEKRLILNAINAHGTNKSALAEIMGINRTALLYKLKKYRIDI